MLLQELFKDENKDLKSAYSVTINEDSTNPDYSTPPQNLEEIGFVFKVDEDGMLDESLMDIVISYRLTNLPVVMEVPVDLITTGKLEVKYLIQLANNVDFSIALLPPGSNLVAKDISMVQYKEIISNVVDEMLSRPNFDKFIYPVSNFFEYLMLENILGKEKLADFRPENKYVIENYSSVMSKTDSDDFKRIIREKLYDFYGGEHEFKLVASTMIEEILSKAKVIYKDFMSDYIARQNQQNQPPQSTN